MNELQSKINAVKSRIQQIETSDLFSEDDKITLLQSNNKELESLMLQFNVNQSQPQLIK